MFKVGDVVRLRSVEDVPSNKTRKSWLDRTLVVLATYTSEDDETLVRARCIVEGTTLNFYNWRVERVEDPDDGQV